ncbi:MAG: hypothetical protein Q9184_003373 [Pyrenodesmia sp. 2 TL-2023]
MPRVGTFDFGNGSENDWGDNHIPSSIYHPLQSSTDTVDFAYNDEIRSSKHGGGWLEDEDVAPSTANRSEGTAAPSVGLGNIDNTFDNLLYDPNGQQQQPSTLPATTRCPAEYGRHPTQHSSYQSYLPHSIPTPPDISLYPAFSQLGFRDEAKDFRAEITAQRMAEPSLLSNVRARAQSPSQRKNTAGSQDKRMEKRQQPVSLIESIQTPPPDPVRRKGRPKKYRDPGSEIETAPSGMSQRDDDGRKETPANKKGGSLGSSTHSAQSVSSFDFNRLDRLDDSPAAPGVLRLGPRSTSLNSQPSLPDEKGFSIQIGAEVFKLSGASIMSDGYQVTPKDGAHFVRLFADAQFYKLPRLQSQLFESEILVEVGNEHFRIPRDIFSAIGDTPNYFTLGFTVFFSSPGDVFPGLNPRGLLRPPAIHPPRIPNRSPKVFADILHLLRGYPLKIQDADHRAQLLKDARYYNLRGLEQKLIPHSISHNIEHQVSEIIIRLQDIKPSQISLAYDQTSTISPSTSVSSLALSSIDPTWPAYVTYARPYVDETSYHLIVEVPSASSTEPLSLDPSTMRATLSGSTRARITALFQTVANKLNLPTTMPLGLMMNDNSARVSSPGNTPLSDDDVKVVLSKDTHIILDAKETSFAGTNTPSSVKDVATGTLTSVPATKQSLPLPLPPHSSAPNNDSASKRPHSPQTDLPPSKRQRPTTASDSSPSLQNLTWTVHRGQWRLRVQARSPPTSTDTGEEEGRSMEIIMEGVKIEATSGERARNAQKAFLE